MRFGQSKTEASRAATLVVVVLALSIWGQISLLGLIWDVEHGAAEIWRVGLYLLPLLILGPVMVTRNQLGMLLLYPVSLLPSIAILPAAEVSEIMTTWSALRVFGTFAVYQALTSAWMASRGEQGEITSGKSTRGRLYSQFVAARLGPMVLLFVVPVYAVFFDAPIAATIAQNNPGNEAQAQTFMGVVMFFAWAVLIYTLFLVPALNLEYDRRRIRREIERIGEDFASGRRWIRLGIEASLVVFFVTALTLTFAG